MLALVADFHPFTARADDIGQRGVFIQLGAHLVEIGHLQLAAQAHGAAVRGEFAQHDFQQRGFARAIGPDDADAVAAHDGSGVIADHGAVAESLADAFQLRHQLAGTFTLVQLQVDLALQVAALGALHAQLLQAAHAAFVAGTAGFHALADPDFFLRQQLVEAGFFQALGFQPLRLVLLPL
ncbi:hypothetical protein KEGY108214_08280 [Kerstersia gyiorum]